MVLENRSSRCAVRAAAVVWAAVVAGLCVLAITVPPGALAAAPYDRFVAEVHRGTVRAATLESGSVRWMTADHEFLTPLPAQRTECLALLQAHHVSISFVPPIDPAERSLLPFALAAAVLLLLIV